MTAVLARCAIGVECRVAYRLIDDDVAIANFDVIEAVGIGAYPRLELNGRSLAAKIRQRNQISRAALTTAWECVFDPHLPVLTLQCCWSAHIKSQEPYIHMQRLPGQEKPVAFVAMVVTAVKSFDLLYALA